jgi:hypothetical protein
MQDSYYFSLQFKSFKRPNQQSLTYFL